MIKIEIAAFCAYYVPGTVLVAFHVFSFTPEHNQEREKNSWDH